MLRKHLVPLFSGRSLERIDTQLVSDYLITNPRDGLASKTSRGGRRRAGT